MSTCPACGCPTSNHDTRCRESGATIPDDNPSFAPSRFADYHEEPHHG